MDQETIRLLISGLLTAGAGVGVAFIAAVFNRKNTQTTIAAAADTAEAARKHEKSLEHSRWLRDRKMAAYSGFIRHIGNLAHEFDKAQRTERPDTSAMPAAGGGVFETEVLLLAPPEIAMKAVQVTSAAEAAKKAAGNTHTDEGLATYTTALRSMSENFSALQQLMRKDLQTNYDMD